MGNKKDVVGEVYNRFTILEMISNKVYGNRYVKAECSCGIIKEVIYTDLVRGRVKSCGCLNGKDKINIESFEIFNYWTVVKEVEKVNNKTSFLCKCVCGKEAIISSNALRKGKSKSCGCKNSSRRGTTYSSNLNGETKIPEITLEKLNNRETGDWKITELISAERNEKLEIIRTVRAKCKCGYEKICNLRNVSKSKQCVKCATWEIRNKLSEDERLIKSRLKSIYSNMKSRCSNPNCKSYPDYGAKGIRVEESFNEFSKFHNWALNNGYIPDVGLEIDRRDGTKGYSEDNCRFISKSENILNSKYINLTIEDVLWIRSDDYSMKKALRKFTCSKNVILNIRNFKTFKDII